MDKAERRTSEAERVRSDHVATAGSHFSSIRRSWLGILPVFFLTAGTAALAIDCPLAQWCIRYHWPEWAQEIFQFGECFGNALGAILVLLAAFQLAPEQRWALPRVVTIAFGAGIASDLVKLLVVRVRPHHFDFAGGVWQTFGEWLPVGSGGSGNQSFPSGHTAVAVGLAIGMTWLCRRGFWLFFGLAVLAACQRVASGAHYLSDVLFAAAVASAVALACLRVGPLPTWFDRWESAGRTKSNARIFQG